MHRLSLQLTVVFVFTCCCILLATVAAEPQKLLSGTVTHIGEDFNDGVLIDFSDATSDQNYTLVDCKTPLIEIRGTSNTAFNKIIKIVNPIGLDNFTIWPETLSDRTDTTVISVIELELFNIVNMSNAILGKDVFRRSVNTVLMISHSTFFHVDALNSEYLAFEQLAFEGENATVKLSNTSFTVNSQEPARPDPVPEPEPAATPIPTASPGSPPGGNVASAKYFTGVLSNSKFSLLDARSTFFVGLVDPLMGAGEFSTSLHASFIRVNDNVNTTGLMRDAFKNSTDTTFLLKHSTMMGWMAFSAMSEGAKNFTWVAENLEVKSGDSFVNASQYATGGVVNISAEVTSLAERSFSNLLCEATETIVQLDLSVTASEGAFVNALRGFSHGSSTVPVRLTVHGKYSNPSSDSSFEYFLANCTDVQVVASLYEVSEDSFLGMASGATNVSVAIEGSIRSTALRHLGSWSTDSSFIVTLETGGMLLDDALTEALNTNLTLHASHGFDSDNGFKRVGKTSTDVTVSFSNTSIYSRNHTFSRTGAGSTRFKLNIFNCSISANEVFATALVDSTNAVVRISNTTFGARHWTEDAELPQNYSVTQSSNFSFFEFAASSQGADIIVESCTFGGNHSFFMALKSAKDFTLKVSDTVFSSDASNEFLEVAAGAKGQSSIDIVDTTFNGTTCFTSLGIGAQRLTISASGLTFGTASSANFNDTLKSAGFEASASFKVPSFSASSSNELGFVGHACEGCSIALTGESGPRVGGRESLSNLGHGSIGASISVENVDIDTVNENTMSSICEEASACTATLTNIQVFDGANALFNAGAFAFNNTNITIVGLELATPTTVNGPTRSILANMSHSAVDSSFAVSNVVLDRIISTDELWANAGRASENCRIAIHNVDSLLTISIGNHIFSESAGAVLRCTWCNASVMFHDGFTGSRNGYTHASISAPRSGTFMRAVANNSVNVSVFVHDFTATAVLKVSFTSSINGSIRLADSSITRVLSKSLSFAEGTTVELLRLRGPTEVCEQCGNGAGNVTIEVNNSQFADSFASSFQQPKSAVSVTMRDCTSESGAQIGVSMLANAQASLVEIVDSDFSTASASSFTDALARSSESSLRIAGSTTPISNVAMLASNFTLSASASSVLSSSDVALNFTFGSTAILEDTELKGFNDFGLSSTHLSVTLRNVVVQTSGAMNAFMKNVSDSTFVMRGSKVLAEALESAFADVTNTDVEFTDVSFAGGDICRSCLAPSRHATLNMTACSGTTGAAVLPLFATSASDFTATFTELSNMAGESLLSGGASCQKCLISIEESSDFSGRAGEKLLAASSNSRVVLYELTNIWDASFSRMLDSAIQATSSVSYISGAQGTSLLNFGANSQDSNLCLRAASIHHSVLSTVVTSVAAGATNSHIMCMTRTASASLSLSESPSPTTSPTREILPTPSASDTLSVSVPISETEEITNSSTLDETYTREPTRSQSCRDPTILKVDPTTIDVLRLVDGTANISIIFDPPNSISHMEFNITWGSDRISPQLRGWSLFNDRSQLEIKLSAPKDTALREDAVIDITIGRNSFGCPPPSNLETRVNVEGLPTAIDVQVKKSIQVAATATGAIAGVLSNPTLALQQNRLGALFMLSSCRFEHSEEVDSANNPAGWRFGTPMGQYYRGAIIGNVVITIASSLGLLLVGFVVHLFVSNRRKTLWGSVGMVHFPGLAIVPYTIVSQGTMMASVAVMLHGADRSDMLLGAFGICFGLATVTLCAIATTRYFNTACIERDKVERKNESAKSALRRLTTMFYTQYKWIDNGTGYRAHFQHLFHDFRPGRQWYLAVEISMTLIMGALDGIRPNSSIGCTVVLGAMGLTCVALFVFMIVLHPFAARYNIYHGLLANGCAVVSACCLVAAQTSRSETPVALSEYSSLLAMGVGMLKMSVDVLFLVLWMKTRSGQLLSRFNQTFRSSANTLTEEDLAAMMVLDVPDATQPAIEEELPEALPEGEELEIDFDMDELEPKSIPAKEMEDDLDTWLLGGPAEADPFASDEPVDNAFLEEKERKMMEIRQGLAKGTFEDGDAVP